MTEQETSSTMKGNATDVAVRYYRAVRAGDWDEAYNLTQLTWRYYFDPDAKEPIKKPDDLRELWEASPFIRDATEIGTSTCVLSHVMGSPALVDAYVKMTTAEGEELVYVCRMIKESKPFTVSIEGEWGVNPISSLRTKGLTDV